MTTKDKVLEILSQNKNKSVSGEKLAEVCQVSRAAIWKAVKSLREQGCIIDGTTNGGYLLSGNGDVFSHELFSSTFKNRWPEFQNSHLETFQEIDSTNTYAKRILSECGNLRDLGGRLTEAGKKYHQSVIVAESQTAGRGRLGRKFISPAKTGIYLSLIYAPENGITEPAKVTAFSAVAIVRAIKKLFNIDARIKWINDIYINSKKVSGILTEGFANFETGLIESAIIGIGINIQDNEIVSKNAAIAGSITGTERTNDSSVSRTALAAEVAGQVLSVLNEEPSKVMKEYKDYCFLTGKTVQVHPVIGDDKSVYSAKVLDVDDNAALVVELSDGSRKSLSSGEVSLHQE